ncbi:MAG TPA: aldehyde dehydrogenase family protein [Pseudonocardiaceae bacterium]|jgi:benzaldehyde dehydrogenase (NAD)|nr:aldehyde dehydrogenase family protein [Pseudonocardiaceae bacterium]
MSLLGSAGTTLFDTLTGAVTEVRNPATGAVTATFRPAEAADVSAATDRALAAQVDWAAAGPLRRAEVMHDAARLILEHEQEFVDWGIKETGGIAAKAAHEVHASHGELLAAAALATEPYGQLAPTGAPRLSLARRIPFGVVGIIAPWNFPLVLAMRAVAPALVLGNAVLLKPDHQTPVFGGALIGRLLEEAGLPAGVLAVLPGPAATGAALVDEPRVPMISFTGSTRAGKLVGQAAAANLKKVSLELGGNNALIVLDDADVAAASSIGAWGSFFHQGQICLTTGRHLVQRGIAEAYVEALAARAEKLRVGDPADPQVQLGPIINATQLATVDRIVADTLKAGATARTGGAPTGDGLFYPATVLTGVTRDMPAFTEEIFGPVAPITVFDEVEEAVALANSSPYGLSAAVLTGAPFLGWQIAERLRAGMVHVNDTTVNDDPTSPFGGMGASGNGGRYGGQANWEEFTQWQWLTVRDTPASYPF